MMSPEEILASAGVRPTAVRILILRELARHDNPVTSQQLELALQSVDRSSITRAMSLFLEKGLIHQIDDGSGSMRYELCTDRHNDDDDAPHSDMHVHFHCRVCGQTECLRDVETPRVTLPEGYEGEQFNYVVSGVCGKCARKV